MKAEEGIHSTLTTKTDNIIGCYGDVTDFTEEELEALDAEGRTVITQFPPCSLCLNFGISVLG
jgi:hypothetical protein